MTSRGSRREAIYRTDTDRRRFLELVAELQERSGLEIARADRIAWAEIGAMAERLRGRCGPEMAEDWGDWERDGTISVAVRHGRHRLAEVVRAVSGLTYGAAARAVRRFTAGMPLDAARIRFVEEMRRRLEERREKP